MELLSFFLFIDLCTSFDILQLLPIWLVVLNSENDNGKFSVTVARKSLRQVNFHKIHFNTLTFGEVVLENCEKEFYMIKYLSL